MKHIYHLPEKYSLDDIQKLYGLNDENLHLIEKEFSSFVNGNGMSIFVDCDDATFIKISMVLDELLNKISNKEEINSLLLRQLINRIKDDESIDVNVKFATTYNGKSIKPLNKIQYDYYNLLANKTIVFAMGAAGTGKTYLAVAYACQQLKNRKIKKIIITRPIVEAGENLGFLPGEIKEKVDPYLIPIYDALHEILGVEVTNRYLEKQVIEIAPLAYMRGRTLNDAFIILDEAQNTTSPQMKMFLTRLGYNAQMVITGDESQVDLKDTNKSGIIIANNILKDIDEIGFVHFNSHDVVRHPLVSKIINAYENHKM